MLITQPIGKKNQNGSKTCLMGPGEVVFGGKNQVQKSRKTVPLIVIAHALELLFEKLTGYVCSKKYVYNYRIKETVIPGSCPMFVEKLLSREIRNSPF